MATDDPEHSARNGDRCPRCKPIPQSPENPEADCYLFGQYLGDGHLVTTVRTPVLRIACDNAYPGIMSETRAACLTALANRVQLVNRGGYTHVQSYSTHWLCLIPQHGPGLKHTRKIELEGWQRDLVEEYPRPFFAGSDPFGRVPGHQPHDPQRQALRISALSLYELFDRHYGVVWLGVRSGGGRVAVE